MAIAAFCMSAGGPAQAQEFPSKPIFIVVGPGPDTVARLIGQKMTEDWGQQVLIDPQPAAGGMVAARNVAKAAADGYTMLLTTGSYSINEILRPQQSAKLMTDFAPVIEIASLPFVILVRAIDYLEREPFVLQVSAVAWGGLVATSAAISASGAMQNVLAKVISPQYAAEWGPAVVGAIVEEILKVLGVVTIALIARGHINSVVDGLVYGALVGLGIQVVEDILFAMNAVAVQAGDDRLGPVVVTFFLRGFLGGLWSHTLFTGMAGAGVAYALIQRNRPLVVRAAVLAVLMGAAWGFHFLWNSPLLADGFG